MDWDFPYLIRATQLIYALEIVSRELHPKQVLDNLGQYSDEEPLRIYDEPSPAHEFPSLATNSPPNSYTRIEKL
jgi:hypothetical protein